MIRSARGRESKKFACRRWRGRTGEKGGAAAGEGLADSACPECRDAIVRGTCVILRRHGDIDLVPGAEIEILCRLFTHARARSRAPRLDPVCGSPSYLSATRSHRRSWFVSSIQAHPKISSPHRTDCPQVSNLRMSTFAAGTATFRPQRLACIGDVQRICTSAFPGRAPRLGVCPLRSLCRRAPLSTSALRSDLPVPSLSSLRLHYHCRVPPMYNSYLRQATLQQGCNPAIWP